MSRVMLVVPCYNEANRLDIETYRQFANSGVQFCFADDGSTDETYLMLQKAFAHHKNIRIFKSPRNLGKAEVIRAAILDIMRSGLPYETEWVGYWDADLATPLDEIEKLFRFHAVFNPNAKAIFGSRVLRLGANIVRSPLRHYLGRMFATVSSVMLKVYPYDSQCGAKIFHKDILQAAFIEPFISRWVFDLEILLRIGEGKVVEVPLSEWKDVPGSKVKIFKEALRVLKDLWNIRKKYYASRN